MKWLLWRRLLLRGLTPVVPLIARAATIRYSLCVTACPAPLKTVRRTRNRPHRSWYYLSTGAPDMIYRRPESLFRKE